MNQNCDRQIDYYSDILAGEIVAGLANMEHQSKILAEAATFTMLQQTLTNPTLY